MRNFRIKSIVLFVLLSCINLRSGSINSYNCFYSNCSLTDGYPDNSFCYSEEFLRTSRIGTVNVNFKGFVNNSCLSLGKKKVILETSPRNEVGILSQDMISHKNTKYIIKNDFVLINDLTIPSGCELLFDGGSVNGPYILTGSNTKIQAPSKQVFGDEVVFAGKWNAEEAYPEWIGAKGDGLTDDTQSIQKLLDIGFQHIYFNEGTYMIQGFKEKSGSPVQPGFWGIKIRSNTSVRMHENAVLKCFPVEGDYYVIVDISGVENVSFTGGQIQGDRHTEHGEWGYGINVTNSKNITIQNVKVYDCLGDGISFNGRNTSKYPNRNTSYDCTVKNCDVYNCRRLALAIAGAERLVVDGCRFINTHGTEPQCAVDIELDIIPGSNRDIEIKNCIMQGNAKGIIWGRGNHQNIYIHDCVIDGVRLGGHPIKNFRFESNVVGLFTSAKGEAKNNIVINRCDIDNLVGGAANKIFFNKCNIKSKAINFGYQETHSTFKDCDITINNEADNVSLNSAILELYDCKININGKSYHLICSNDLIAERTTIESNAIMTKYAVPLVINNSVIMKNVSLSSYYDNPNSFVLLATNGDAIIYDCHFVAKGECNSRAIFSASSGKTPSIHIKNVVGKNFDAAINNEYGQNRERKVTLK